MTTFTPYSAALGGLLIGLAAVLLLWANGRIAGISGILSGAVWSSGSERFWRIAFLIGIMGGAWIAYELSGRPFSPRQDFSPLRGLAAGLFIGLGTALGSGCTSGHGVCGISRLSVRSIVATLTFMLTAILVVWLIRHGLGLSS